MEGMFYIIYSKKCNVLIHFLMTMIKHLIKSNVREGRTIEKEGTERSREEKRIYFQFSPSYQRRHGRTTRQKVILGPQSESRAEGCWYQDHLLRYFLFCLSAVNAATCM